MQKVAILTAKGLGDGLLFMILASNFKQSGYDVSIFSTILTEISSWLPEYKILPFPDPELFFETFSSFDLLIAADHSLVKEQDNFNNRLIVLKECIFNKRKTLADNLQKICKNILKLPFCDKTYRFSIPPHLTWRKYEKRVVIHPTSSNIKKNWEPKKFYELQQMLKEYEFEPIVCVSPKEKDSWPESPLFEKVSSLAEFVYESGYMIGNDSGVGHLASALGIPTVSIFARKGYSRLWRPGWSIGEVASSPFYLFGAHMKQKYWKKTLKPSTVLKKFLDIESKANELFEK